VEHWTETRSGHQRTVGVSRFGSSVGICVEWMEEAPDLPAGAQAALGAVAATADPERLPPKKAGRLPLPSQRRQFLNGHVTHPLTSPNVIAMIRARVIAAPSLTVPTQSTKPPTRDPRQAGQRSTLSDPDGIGCKSDNSPIEGVE
jgi:hypothetical protein